MINEYVYRSNDKLLDDDLFLSKKLIYNTLVGSKAFLLVYVDNEGIEKNLHSSKIIKNGYTFLSDEVYEEISKWLYTGGEVEEISGINLSKLDLFIEKKVEQYKELSLGIINALGKNNLYPDIVGKIYLYFNSYSHNNLISQVRLLYNLRKYCFDNKLLKDNFLLEYTEIVPLKKEMKLAMNRHERKSISFDFSKVRNQKVTKETLDILRKKFKSQKDLVENIIVFLEHIKNQLGAIHISLVYENGKCISVYEDEFEKYDRSFEKRMIYLKKSIENPNRNKKLKKVLLTQVCGLNADMISVAHNKTKPSGVGSFIKVILDELTERNQVSDSDLRISFGDIRDINIKEIALAQIYGREISNKLLHFCAGTNTSIENIFKGKKNEEENFTN